MQGSNGQQHLAGDPSAFSQMVSQMLSPQNEQRRAAEALFAEAKKAQGDFTASSLVALLRQAQQLDARALCAVAAAEGAAWPDAMDVLVRYLRQRLGLSSDSFAGADEGRSVAVAHFIAERAGERRAQPMLAAAQGLAAGALGCLC